MNKLTTWLRRFTIAIAMIVLIIFAGIKTYAQQPKTLSIENAYQLARKNYPLGQTKRLN